ncbi:uncharacterized protein EAE97_009263 [Botrytis byssoidea]|uniref:U3 small nucleolar RNA-associated protein 25 n=1 Tax=Botrytis byssoidea TaxID=139641 RepID=A0A9P5I9T4_9HELO|nr:uncharacterized protein EAE97_009263 [Botrytis byssoidea]KAF7931054.1 hypothetical protein EAE97_009263 [Botrytis byssoidea]
MAFGQRNTSRGGRGGGGGGSSFRGRGGGRGGPRGRGGMRGGRGRGRGRPVFDSARLAQKEEDEASDSESEEPSQDEVTEEESSDDDDDDEPAPAVKSYAALMQSFTRDSAPQAKRRKLNVDKEEKEDEELDLMDEDTNDADLVEEEEEGPETATEGVLDDDDEEDKADPFEAHFANPDDNILSRRLQYLEKGQWALRMSSLAKVGTAITSIPGDGEPRAMKAMTISNPDSLKLKQKLANVIKKQRPTFDALERSIAPLIFGYQDLLFTERNTSNAESLRRLTCLHAVNHVFKTRDRVIKNNSRLAKEDSSDDLELRDQGFTRPKVLMLLPTRESCVRMVDMITSLCEPEQQENRKRFNDSFVDKEDNYSTDKPVDFRELFAGNDDDMFRLGLKFTRKTIKYFSQFYNSDIIFASPLGLRMAIGDEDAKKVDHDFLSSIEMVIVDQADALLMQNWEHVEFIFDHLNLQPKEAHGCDFSRVRSWYLDNNAKYFRQTIALASFNTPELQTMFYTQSQNWEGKAKVTSTYPGAIQELGLKVKQTFSRIDTESIVSDPESRFEYFTSAIIPTLTRRSKDSSGTLLFIPSYMDFVKVRNYFSTSATTSSLSFGSISEYTTPKEVARARSHFFSGRHNVLLYTERAHHFRRYQIRGVKKVIMYGIPENPIFYKEIVGGYLGRSVREGDLEPGAGSVRAVFSKWDSMKLERIAGTERVNKMIKEKGDTFDFL